MSANVFKRLNVADTFVAPYTANKSWEISSSSFAEKRIITNIGVNQSGSIFDPNQDYYTNGQYDRLVYDSINLLYYPSFFPTGSPLFYSERLNSPIFDATFTSASYWKGHINLGNLDTTKYFPTTSGSVIYVLNIPKSLASEKILPNTFEVYFSSGSNYTAKIYDDGNYNLFYSGSNVSSSIGTVLSQSSYVGNVFYEQNVAVLTVVPNSIRLMGWIGADPYCVQALAASPSVTPSITRSVSRTPSITPTKTPSRTIPRTPSVTPSVTITPTRTPSITPSVTVTKTPSMTPTPTKTKFSVGLYAKLESSGYDMTNAIHIQYSTTSIYGPWTTAGSAITGTTCTLKDTISNIAENTVVYFQISTTDGLNPVYHSTNNTSTCPASGGTTCVSNITVTGDTSKSFTVTIVSGNVVASC